MALLVFSNIGFESPKYTVQQDGVYKVDMNLDITGQPADASQTFTGSLMTDPSTTFLSSVSQYGSRKTVQISDLVFLTKGTELSAKLSSSNNLDGRSFAGGYSVYFLESLADTFGIHSRLSSNFQINQVNQWVAVDSNWVATNAQFAVNADAAPYTIPVDGIYLMSFTATFDRVDFGVRAAIYIVTASSSTINGDNAQGKLTSSSSSSETLVLHTAVHLKAGDQVSFRIFAESGEGSVTLLQDRTRRSIVQIEGSFSELSEGASMYLPVDIPRFIGVGERLIPNNWQQGDSYPGTFIAKNVTFGPSGEIVVLRPGVFHVTMNVIIKNWDVTPR